MLTRSAFELELQLRQRWVRCVRLVYHGVANVNIAIDDLDTIFRERSWRRSAKDASVDGAE